MCAGASASVVGRSVDERAFWLEMVYVSRVPPTHVVGCSSVGGLDFAEMTGHVCDNSER